jgi:hypothetical protein
MEPSIEHLLKLLVVEWQLTRTSPMGMPLSGVEHGDNEISITLSPLAMDRSGCPRNFHEFYESAKEMSGMQTKRDAFLWYCRTRLHYSCSTVCVTFTEFVVPELLKRGMHHLLRVPTLNSDDHVDIRRIKIKGLNFAPVNGTTHCLKMGSFIGLHKNPVEVGSHNMLECSETGRVFDPTIGQLTGTMQPELFSSLREFRHDFLGVVFQLFDSSQQDIEAQKNMDVDLARMNKKPHIHPSKVAKRVVDAFLSDDCGLSTYCSHCLGCSALGSKLLKCSACKKVFYCSKTCQMMAWKEHKVDCAK